MRLLFPTTPVLSGGVLTLASATQAQSMHSTMTGADLDFSAPGGYWLQGTVKYVSGSRAAGWWRAPVYMAMTFDNGNVAVLEIQQDSIFIRNGNNAVAAVNNGVDTDGAFHTYRMEIAGKSAGSAVQVFQDGVLVLSAGAVFGSGGGAAVSFGEASILATGTSQWAAFSHNVAAVAVPEPAPWALLVAGTGVLGGCAARRRAGGGRL